MPPTGVGQLRNYFGGLSPVVGYFKAACPCFVTPAIFSGILCSRSDCVLTLCEAVGATEAKVLRCLLTTLFYHARGVPCLDQ